MAATGPRPAGWLPLQRRPASRLPPVPLAVGASTSAPVGGAPTGNRGHSESSASHKGAPQKSGPAGAPQPQGDVSTLRTCFSEGGFPSQKSRNAGRSAHTRRRRGLHTASQACARGSPLCPQPGWLSATAGGSRAPSGRICRRPPAAPHPPCKTAVLVWRAELSYSTVPLPPHPRRSARWLVRRALKTDTRTSRKGMPKITATESQM